MKTTHTEMSALAVIDLYQKLQELNVQIWIDGGWGVDALLQKQTRPHKDLDIVIQEKDLAVLHALLEPQGYKNVPRDDTCAWNFVLGNAQGQLIDVHVIVFDEAGNGLYGPLEKGVMYPAASLTGQGIIDGHKVQCISPEYMVKFHTGYPLKETDYQDVRALCEKFNIEYPEEYLIYKT